MATGVYVPRWGITMERGLIATWLVGEGQQVAKGQPLLELETEKITNVVEAPVDGTLRLILAPAGERPAVGELIAIIAEPEEEFDIATLRDVAPAVVAGGGGLRLRREARPAERTERGRVKASPAARRLAEECGVDLTSVAGTGPQGSVSREDVERAIMDAVAATVEEGHVAVGELNLHYVAAGGAATGLKVSDPALYSGQALTVVLVHGLGGSTVLWQPNVTALATRHRTFALDLPGHGLSSKPPAAMTNDQIPMASLGFGQWDWVIQQADYSVGFFARALSAFLDALGVERVALVGHSLSGHVCLRLALEQPGRVVRLVLVDAGGLGKEINTAFLQPMLAGLSREATEIMLRGLFYNPAFITRPMVEATYAALAQPGAWEALVAAARSTNAGDSQAETLVDRLAELALPTLLIWGAEDSIIPVAHGRAAQAAIPGAELWVADAAGHCPQIEAAEAFNRRVAMFLEGD